MENATFERVKKSPWLRCIVSPYHVLSSTMRLALTIFSNALRVAFFVAPAGAHTI
jgi:hypothetical protein